MNTGSKCYVFCVSGKEYLQDGWQQVSVGSILKNLDERKWFLASCGDGSKGARVYDWQVLELKFPVVLGWRRCLLVRRGRFDGELRVYVCFAPEGVSVLKLVEVVGVRWIVGWCFAESKSLVGLDRYGVQSYFGWYKYITFACLAHALLVVFSSCSLGVKTIVRCDPSFCGSLFGFKRKRGLYV